MSRLQVSLPETIPEDPVGYAEMLHELAAPIMRHLPYAYDTADTAVKLAVGPPGSVNEDARVLGLCSLAMYAIDAAEGGVPTNRWMDSLQATIEEIHCQMKPVE